MSASISLPSGFTGGNVLPNLSLTPSWFSQLQPASWRGLPFGVLDSEILRGRKTAEHEYPFRDGCWVEDLGRATRRVGVRGWIVGPNMLARRQAFADACEIAGDGTLVHPQLGSLNLTLAKPASIKDQWDEGQVVRIDLEFIESLTKLFPVGPADFLKTILSNVSSVIVAAQTAIATVMSTVFAVSGAIASAVATVTQFVAMVARIPADAGAAFNSVLGLAGSFGRYNTGALAALQPASATVDSLLAGATAARAQLETDAAAAIAAAPGAVNDPAPLAAAIVTLLADVPAVVANPADVVRLLASLASFQPTGLQGSGATGAAQATARSAVGDLCRQAALAQLVTAITVFQPSSRQDAIILLDQVAGLIDNEVTIAGDAGNDDLFTALILLRASVVQQLFTVAGDLPDIITISTAVPMPAPALAYRQYQDATRADDLIQRADPPHPGFFPLSFEALAS